MKLERYEELVEAAKRGTSGGSHTTFVPAALLQEALDEIKRLHVLWRGMCSETYGEATHPSFEERTPLVDGRLGEALQR